MQEKNYLHFPKKITPQPIQSVSLSVELKRKKRIDKNLIIYIIKNFTVCIFRFESD